MKSSLIILIILIVFDIHILAGETIKSAIIPKPLVLEKTEGIFKLTSATSITVSENLSFRAIQLKGYLEPALGYDLLVSHKAGLNNSIELKIDKSLGRLGDEGYLLDITKEKILLTAFQDKGIFYGIQTLRQLLPSEILRDTPVKQMDWQIPCLKIEDKPRFKWRGLMLDCSRTFISKEQIKRYLEILSFFKMNVLHMHLTDDQGWRVEILRYPELTKTASKFHESFQEPKEYEGYYLQGDIRELIEYATQRNIEIIPEIEMPGHSSEVFAAFPQLSCKGDTTKIHPFFKGPGVHNEIFCAGNDKSFEFLYHVLDEISELFPSPYVHIGGDEAPKAHWKTCPKCQKRILDEGLKDENELQSWFVKRIEKYLNNKGKRLIGWDEITEGGLSPTATVMYWRGWEKDVPAKVAERGNDMIMTPTDYSYFDYSNEKISTEKIYSVNPVPQGFSSKQRERVLGVQANFWSHIDRTPPVIDRQLFPRLIALSEIAWAQNENKDWNEFNLRLGKIEPILDIMGINYFIKK
ncbi:MAG: beta-N-acetylhexosaminidase [Mariniphaga sp.]